MKRIKGLDFTRVILTCGIIAYHFSCYSSANLSFLYQHANGVWGGTFNAAFFALSGFLIQYQYGKERLDISWFYYKRWKTIVFPYVLVFLYAYLINVATTGKFFYLNIPKWILILSFFGIDGYVYWIQETYFITGVWFVGAILLIYLLYPLLHILFKNVRIALGSILVLFIVYELIRSNGWFSFPVDINPVTCILSFSIGMMLAKTEKLFKKYLFFLSFLCVIFIILPFPIEVSHNTKELIVGWLLFILLSNIGYYIKSERFNTMMSSLNKASYPIILVHLPIIHLVFVGWNKNNPSFAILILIILFVLLCVLGLIIDVIIKKIYGLSIFIWLDKKFR